MSTTDTDSPHVPILAQREAEPNRVLVYRALLERWLQGGPIITPDGVARARSQALFANLIDYPPQRVTNWKSGENGHTPPWWVIMWLCNALGAQIILDPSGMGVAWPDAESA